MKSLTLTLAVLLALVSPAPVQADGCSLIVNSNRVSVTVNRGPCYVRDFPAWCDEFVPAVIIQGQTIPCEAVILVATATPAPAPKPTPAPAPAVTPTRWQRFCRSLPGALQRGCY